jgi:hypothetical protein
VKHVERLNIWDACDQAQRDACGKSFVIAHTKNFRPWLVTMEAETFFRLVRQFEPPRHEDTKGSERAERGGDAAPPYRGELTAEAQRRGCGEALTDLGETPEMNPRDAGATNNNETKQPKQTEQ